MLSSSGSIFATLGAKWFFLSAGKMQVSPIPAPINVINKHFLFKALLSN